MADKHTRRRSREPDIVAGNGLIDRRALLGRGIVYAGAVSAGVGASLNGAAAEPLRRTACISSSPAAASRTSIRTSTSF
jgi:hypothetical protein